MRVILRNAHVIDGSGEPGFSEDVAIEEHRIVAIGTDLASPGDEIVDLDGLVLSPGFIDPHTHFDAQVLWDRDFTPSAWHGVTTVVMGNCGFGIAPTATSGRDRIALTLENVEGMSVEALQAGIRWDFETYPEYLDLVESVDKRINVGSLIGHTPLRLYVMGSESTEREATDEEVERMCAIVAEAIEAGAVGFATSMSPNHKGAWGAPVPSRLASMKEFEAIADVLAAAGRGVIQADVGPGLFIREMAALSVRSTRPTTWVALLTNRAEFGGDLSGMEEFALPPLELLDRQCELDGDVWPQVACRPIVMQFTLLNPPVSLTTSESMREILTLPKAERAGLMREPQWRERARVEVNQKWRHLWSRASVQETTNHPELRDVPLDQAAADRGIDPFDLMLDTALHDDLLTRFTVAQINYDEAGVGELLQDQRTLLGLSDAGAHASQLCDACYSTYLLGHWVREKGALTLEQAVWRLTGQSANVMRIGERGLIREGYMADLVAFDAATVGALPLERVYDLPAGADRLIARSIGIEHVWVNGTAIRRDGREVDAHPGVLIRGGVE